jgi:hypothetical protein
LATNAVVEATSFSGLQLHFVHGFKMLYIYTPFFPANAVDIVTRSALFWFEKCKHQLVETNFKLFDADAPISCHEGFATLWPVSCRLKIVLMMKFLSLSIGFLRKAKQFVGGKAASGLRKWSKRLLRMPTHQFKIFGIKENFNLLWHVSLWNLNLCYNLRLNKDFFMFQDAADFYSEQPLLSLQNFGLFSGYFFLDQSWRGEISGILYENKRLLWVKIGRGENVLSENVWIVWNFWFEWFLNKLQLRGKYQWWLRLKWIGLFNSNDDFFQVFYF